MAVGDAEVGAVDLAGYRRRGLDGVQVEADVRVEHGEVELEVVESDGRPGGLVAGAGGVGLEGDRVGLKAGPKE